MCQKKLTCTGRCCCCVGEGHKGMCGRAATQMTAEQQLRHSAYKASITAKPKARVIFPYQSNKDVTEICGCKAFTLIVHFLCISR